MQPVVACEPCLLPFLTGFVNACLGRGRLSFLPPMKCVSVKRVNEEKQVSHQRPRPVGQTSPARCQKPPCVTTAVAARMVR